MLSGANDLRYARAVQHRELTLPCAWLCLTLACSGGSRSETPPPAPVEPAPAAPAELSNATPAEAAEPSAELPTGKNVPGEPAAEPARRPAEPRTSKDEAPAKPASSKAAAAKAEPVAAKPAPPEPIPEQPTPPAAEPASPKEAAPARPPSKVAVPQSEHVHVDVPRGLQALLDADPRMQPWVTKVMAVVDQCYATERARSADAAGVVEVAVTMHANARPDADIRTIPPSLGGLAACATSQLMRQKRMPLFTGPEGEKHTLRIRFSR